MRACRQADDPNPWPGRGAVKELIRSQGHPFPAWLSFHLNNGLRRRFHPPEKIITALDVKATDTVLDFGCGPGFFTIPFARTAKKVVAVDLQPKMLLKAAQYAEKNGVTIRTIQSNGQFISLPNESCDLIFLSGVYHELPEKRRVLLELKRTLKPRGRIVIRERTKRPRFSLGPPEVNPTRVSEAVGFRAAALVSDPTEKGATLITASQA